MNIFKRTVIMFLILLLKCCSNTYIQQEYLLFLNFFNLTFHFVTDKCCIIINYNMCLTK